MKATIYSRPACGWCMKAKNLMALKGVEYTERLMQLSDVEMFKTMFGVEVKTVPQIILDDKYVGGYDKLEKILK